MKKGTEELVNEITQGKSVAEYLASNRGEFFDIPLSAHLKELLQKKGMRVSQAADKSNKGEYIYQVFRGIKNPGRDVVLCIALAMKLDLEETQHLLRIGRMACLDARNRRDSMVIFGIARGISVAEVNDILYEFGEECL